VINAIKEINHLAAVRKLYFIKSKQHWSRSCIL